MAYNIKVNEQTGKHSFFFSKGKARHGLEQIVEGYPTSAEALQFAGLHYTIEKRLVEDEVKRLKSELGHDQTTGPQDVDQQIPIKIQRMFVRTKEP